LWISSLAVSMCETIGSALGRLSCEVGKFVYLCENKYIEFSKAGELINSTPTTIEIGKDRVKSIRLTENIEGAASVVCGCSHFDFETSRRYSVRLPVKSFPPGLVMPNFIVGANSQQEIRRLCERRCAEIANDMISIEIELVGVKNMKRDVDTNIWHVNNRVILIDSTGKFRFDGEYNIETVEFRQSKNEGTTSKLTLGGLPL